MQEDIDRDGHTDILLDEQKLAQFKLQKAICIEKKKLEKNLKSIDT